MKRYLKLYVQLIKVNWAAFTMHRANVANSMFSSIMWSVFHILTMVFLTARASHVFGWSREELLMLAGVGNIFFGIFNFSFARNFTEFSRVIHFGRLDSILIKPVDSQWLMSIWFVSFASLTRVVIGTIFTLYVMSYMQRTFSLLQITSSLLLLFFGISILYAVSFGIMTITIWFSNLTNLRDLLFQLNGTTRYPQEMYRGGKEVLFYVIFPLTLVVAIPTKALLNRITITDIVSIILCSIGMLLVSRLFWKRALRSYTSSN